MTELEAREVIQHFCTLVKARPATRGDMIERLVAFFHWLSGDLCTIRDINERLVWLHPNRAQLVIIAMMMTQAARNRPIRIVVLKARKVGVTTLIQAFFAFLVAHYFEQVACTLAHLASSTDEIFEIGKLVTEKYAGVKHKKIGARVIRHPMTHSRYWCHTAGGGGVAAGGTPNLMHLSERALWQLKAISAEAAAVNAVPSVPTSVIIQESTARGRERFWETYEKARTGQSQYAAVFVPWYWDQRLTAPPAEPFVHESDEKALVNKAHEEGIEISNESLQWRRDKIAEIGLSLFKQEYPSTPEEAVEAAKGLVVPGLRDCIVDSFPFPDADHQACCGGIDFGFAHRTAIITSYYVDRTLYIESVWSKEGTLASDRAEALEEGHTYYCDPSGLESRQELEKAADDIDKQVWLEPAPREKGGSRNDYVTAEWEKVITLARHGRLKILESASSQLIIEADNLMWDEKTGQPQMTWSEACGHFDTLSALRYLVMGVVESVAITQPRRTGVGSERREMRKW